MEFCRLLLAHKILIPVWRKLYLVNVYITAFSDGCAPIGAEEYFSTEAIKSGKRTIVITFLVHVSMTDSPYAR